MCQVAATPSDAVRLTRTCIIRRRKEPAQIARSTAGRRVGVMFSFRNGIWCGYMLSLLATNRVTGPEQADAFAVIGDGFVVPNDTGTDRPK
jgi:hypothetical protein